MEKISQPLSIKIIYWLTNIVFWLFSIAGVVALFFAIGMITGFLHDLDLNIDVPAEISILEKGVLNLDFYSKAVQVELIKSYGTIKFSDTPLLIARFYGVFMIVMISISFFILWEIRSFINNIYSGKYFDYSNINHLKKISYALIVIWAITVVYGYFQYFFIVRKLSFETVQFNFNINVYSDLLVAALLIWVLSHIFMKGLELESENQLTI